MGECQGEWDRKDAITLWREAMYVTPCDFMAEFFVEQNKILEQLVAGVDRYSSIYVEVGCGSGEVNAKMAFRVTYNVGVEINRDGIELAKAVHPSLTQDANTYLVEGNANLPLRAVLESAVPKGFWTAKYRMVTSLSNTLPYLSKKPEAIYDMLLTAKGDDPSCHGHIVLTCFYRNALGLAIREFYQKNPKLVGCEVKPENYNLETGDMRLPSGYYTHWFSKEELAGYYQQFLDICKTTGMDKEVELSMEIKELGVGGICMIITVKNIEK